MYTHDSTCPFCQTSQAEMLTVCCCVPVPVSVSVADGVYQDGTALGRGRQTGLGSAQVCAPLCVYVFQQLCSHPILLLIPGAPAAAENMGQLHFLAHRRSNVQVVAGHGVFMGLDRRLYR